MHRNLNGWCIAGLLAGGISIIIFSSCNNIENPADVSPYPYYPLDSGKYVIYQVDSINYHTAAPSDTEHWEVKETTGEPYYDNAGRLNYKIIRSVRRDSTEDFTVKDVWSALATDGRIERVEENLRFVKLVSPVLDGTNWEGNLYLGGLSAIPVDEDCNNLQFLENWQYSYKDVGLSKQVGTMHFDNTLTVVQNGNINAIEYNYATEIYAKDVGLVSRAFYHYTTQSPCPTCPWEDIVECGYSVRMTVLEYK